MIFFFGGGGDGIQNATANVEFVVIQVLLVNSMIESQQNGIYMQTCAIFNGKTKMTALGQHLKRNEDIPTSKQLSQK